MKWLGIVGVLFIILIMLSAGCISQTNTGIDKRTDADDTLTEKSSERTDNTALSAHTQKDESNQVKKTQSTDEDNLKDTGDDTRYYYNIRIVAPSDLETLKNEITADEYPIYNENGDLIGIVSPRKLYIRGDLVDLQKDTDRSGKTFDKTDVAEHLVDITFGNDNAKEGVA